MGRPAFVRPLNQATRILFALLIIGISALPANGQSIPVSVEEVTRESDLIVLGRVTASDREGTEVGRAKQLVTRHTFQVEAYYKGTGPKKIPLMTLGGMELRKVGNEVHSVYTQALGAEGVTLGEEFLAFLKRGPEGYYFAEWDGAKYLVKADPNTSVRTVDLRLRKKRYMKGAALEGFKRLETLERGSDATASVEANLAGPKFLSEPVDVKDLRARLEEIINGEGIVDK